MKKNEMGMYEVIVMAMEMTKIAYFVYMEFELL